MQTLCNTMIISIRILSLAHKSNHFTNECDKYPEFISISTLTPAKDQLHGLANGIFQIGSVLCCIVKILNNF